MDRNDLKEIAKDILAGSIFILIVIGVAGLFVFPIVVAPAPYGFIPLGAVVFLLVALLIGASLRGH